MASKSYTLPSIERSGSVGELIIAGSGIAAVRQLTIEALQYLQSADVVFYGVCDATTESFIQAHAKEHVDLSVLYDEHKPRVETYIQMAEVMLERVRTGQLVLGLLYGHPGVFVAPTLRALHIAQEEGFKAKMLPGISAEDCLFADLKIDPAAPGCITYEATAMVRQRQLIDPQCHLIVWQVGCVDVIDMDISKNRLELVLDYLEEHYGPDHTIVHYIAGVVPFQKSTIERYRIHELREPLCKNKVLPHSTFYIPPKLRSHPNGKIPLLPPYSAMLLADPDSITPPAYGAFEKQAIKKLEERKGDETSSIYMPLAASQALQRAAIKMALQHHRLCHLPPEKRYEHLEAELTTDILPGLREEELAKIRTCDEIDLEVLMKDRTQATCEVWKSSALGIVAQCYSPPLICHVTEDLGTAPRDDGHLAPVAATGDAH